MELWQGKQDITELFSKGKVIGYVYFSLAKAAKSNQKYFSQWHLFQDIEIPQNINHFLLLMLLLLGETKQLYQTSLKMK